MGLFGGKAAHPLASAKELKRVLEALPDNDLFKALDELMHWVESVAAAEDFKPEARIQLLFALDEAAQPRVRKLARDYFAAGRPSRYMENRIWTAIQGYWKQAGYEAAGAALRRCKPEMARPQRRNEPVGLQADILRKDDHENGPPMNERRADPGAPLKLTAAQGRRKCADPLFSY